MRIFEETGDSPESMRHSGYRLLDSGPIEELSTWRKLFEQGHWLYDTAHEQAMLSYQGTHFYLWVPQEEPNEAP